MIIRTSKALYCDFLLVKLWQRYLVSLGFNPKANLLGQSELIGGFADYLSKELSTDKRHLFEQFNIHSSKDLRFMLQSSYKYLRDKDIEF